MFEFKIPEVGENITTGTVVDVFVSVGDSVQKDQDLFELETDKASLPVPSPVAGTIKEILIKKGDEVKIGQVAIRLESSDESTPAPAKSGKKTTVSTETGAPVPSGKPASSEKTNLQPVQPTLPNQSPQPQPEEKTVDPSQIRVVVLGGGPGGYPAAFHAADLGMRVTLIDVNANPGGVCLHVGCIPSKALLHAAKVLNDAKEAAEIGITYGEPKVDLDKLRAWKDNVVNQLTGGTKQLAKSRKVNTIQGYGKFKDSNTIVVEKTGGGTEEVAFDKAIIATGSRPIMIDAWPKSDRVIDSTGALELKDIPKTMLLVGGGVIGLELGTVYAELGSELDVVEMLPNLINGADRDIVKVLENRLKKILRDIYLETKVTGMTETKDGIKVAFEGKDGKTFEKTYEKVLVAIGRRPNSENIGLENTQVKTDEKGFIPVNALQQTGDPNIYAIGDVVGQPMLAHKATHEGIVAAGVIAGEKHAFEPKAIPAVVYTDPEIAWCGLTETEAKAKGIDYQVAKFPWAASGRAIAMNRTDGLTKLIFDPKTEMILGMGIVGVGAGELISEGVLAIEMAATASDIKLSIHPHPTITETIMESAEMFHGSSIHIYKPKKK